VGGFVSEVEKSGFEEARKLIFQMAELKNQLRELGVIRSEGKITDNYAEWFCSNKFGLELCDRGEFGCDALSKYGEKVQIKSITGSDIDFEIAFDGIRVNEFDYLYVVFINEVTWMIHSVYKVSRDVVKKFLSNDRVKRFEWRRESRSLSLQLYPDEDNMITL
jgi:hypothetical protein